MIVICLNHDFFSIAYTRWPRGDYGIPLSSFGCPSSHKSSWLNGYLKLPAANVTISSPYHLKGPVTKHKAELHACITHSHLRDVSIEHSDWPEGNYCLFKTIYSCPSGKIIRRRNIDCKTLTLLLIQTYQLLILDNWDIMKIQAILRYWTLWI